MHRARLPGWRIVPAREPQRPLRSGTERSGIRLSAACNRGAQPNAGWRTFLGRLAITSGDGYWWPPVGRSRRSTTPLRPTDGSGAVGSALLANPVANLSAADRYGTVGSQPTGRTAVVGKGLVEWYYTRSGSIGRTVLLTLSRWRHGFESRTGCEGTPGQRPSPEGLSPFPGVSARGTGRAGGGSGGSSSPGSWPG